jgi:hypothetical protein
MESRAPLWLDHASILVPDLAPAIEELDSRLGLRATPTPAAPGRHSRLYLERSYLEVSAGAPGDAWTAPYFFLRFSDPEALRRHLDAVELRCRFGRYTGVDGQWDDVEIDAEGVPVPILVRRTHPPDIARDWPPPLREAHRCGARTLAAVQVAVPDLAAATEVYRRLTGSDPERSSAVGDHAGTEFRLQSGRIILTEGAALGVKAIVLGTTSLVQSIRVAGPLSPGPVAWIAPDMTHGLQVGFVPVA